MNARPRILAVFALVMATIFTSPSKGDSSSQARELALEAYHQIEGNVFRRAELQEALEKILLSYALNDREPHAYLAAALFKCVSGYKSNDWYGLENFHPGTIERAVELTLSALEIDPNLSLGHATLGRFLIVQGEFEKASEHLERAYELDNSSFYPHYFMGILDENLGNIEEAHRHLETALRFVTHDYQEVSTKVHQINLAELRQDHAQEEQLLRQIIQDDPNTAQHYGNFANFLLHHRRYDEAIEYYEIAISISSYRAAREGLKMARQRKSQGDQTD